MRLTLTSITIPNGVISIGDNAFSGTSLTSVTIPNSVTSIGEGALATISLTAINVDAGNSAYSSQDGVLYNKAKTALIFCPNRITGAITIPNGVTSIGYSAFFSRTSLTGVTIPNSVTTIGNSAFENCTSLTNVTMNGVKSIGERAFWYCENITSVTIGSGVTSELGGLFWFSKNLTTITVDLGNSVYSSQDNVLYNKDKTTLVMYSLGKTGSFTIPNSVTSIGYEAFSGCTLTSVTIPSSVTSIEIKAFYMCNNLTSVIIPGSVTSIGGGAFMYCSNITSVTFATGSNITSDNFGRDTFPQGSRYGFGNDLQTAYLASSPKAGTYTRSTGGYTWTKQ
jgi:hypothetical protein